MIFRSISIAVLLGLVGYSAEGGTILSSDFNTQTSVQGGTEFTGIVWSHDSAISPVNEVLVGNNSSNKPTVQRDGAATNTSRLAVSHNIDKDGPFSFGVFLTVDSRHDVSVSSLSFDYQFINGNGLNQTAAHPDSGIFTFGVVDYFTAATLGYASVGPLGTTNTTSNSGHSTITLATPVTLLHDGAYALFLQVSSNATTGNNVAVDNFRFDGSSSVYTPPLPAPVPEPASMTMTVMGVIGSLVFARHRGRVAGI